MDDLIQETQEIQHLVRRNPNSSHEALALASVSSDLIATLRETTASLQAALDALRTNTNILKSIRSMLDNAALDTRIYLTEDKPEDQEDGK